MEAVSEHLASGRQRLRDRYAIGILEISPDGQAARDPGDPHPARNEQPLEVQRGGLPFHGRIGGEDDFPYGFGLDPREEGVDGKIRGTDAVDGRQAAPEDVIQPAELAGALDGGDVGRFLDDADELRIAARVLAEGAERRLGEVPTPLASADPLGQQDQRFGEATALIGRLAQQVKDEALRGLSPDAGQARELAGQVVNDGHACDLGVGEATGTDTSTATDCFAACVRGKVV